MNGERKPDRDDGIFSDYDPEKLREALEKYAGAWSDLDGDALIEQLYRSREEGSRPADRPKWRRGGTGK